MLATACLYMQMSGGKGWVIPQTVQEQLPAKLSVHNFKTPLKKSKTVWQEKGDSGLYLGVQAMISLQTMISLTRAKKCVLSLSNRRGMAIFSKFFH
jgi:hypothetical protein